MIAAGATVRLAEPGKARKPESPTNSIVPVAKVWVPLKVAVALWSMRRVPLRTRAVDDVQLRVGCPFVQIAVHGRVIQSVAVVIRDEKLAGAAFADGSVFDRAAVEGPGTCRVVES